MYVVKSHKGPKYIDIFVRYNRDHYNLERYNRDCYNHVWLYKDGSKRKFSFESVFMRIWCKIAIKLHFYAGIQPVSREGLLYFFGNEQIFLIAFIGVSQPFLARSFLT